MKTVLRKIEAIVDAFAVGVMRFWAMCLAVVYLFLFLGLEGEIPYTIIGVIAVVTGVFETVRWIFKVYSIVKAK